jgi:hypothetical protein
MEDDPDYLSQFTATTVPAFNTAAGLCGPCGFNSLQPHLFLRFSPDTWVTERT